MKPARSWAELPLLSAEPRLLHSTFGNDIVPLPAAANLLDVLRWLSTPGGKTARAGMVVISDRFECFADPCGLWTVWDRLYEMPVRASGAHLVGLTQAEAAVHCRMLNAGGGSFISTEDLAALLKLFRR